MLTVVTEKRCTKCGEVKPRALFYQRPASRDGLESHCKQCARMAHRIRYAGNPAACTRWRAANKDRADEIKLSTGCVDCGYKGHPAALDFDHLPGMRKTLNIGASYGRTWDVIAQEIAKCEVVCANCHRIRTVNRRELVNAHAD